MKCLRQAGVTLVELMATLGVITVMASIAMPTYRGYMIKVQRAEARTELVQTATALERCFMRYNRFDHENCRTASSLPRATPAGRYEIRAAKLARASFILHAVPLAKQKTDSDCQTLTLDSANVRGVTGGAQQSAQQCWAP
jgi:type IV pilus assembly protein PilE